MDSIVEEKSASITSELFEAGGHIGYSRSHCHPKMRDFVFGMRNNIEIIDLEESEKMINIASEFLRILG